MTDPSFFLGGGNNPGAYPVLRIVLLNQGASGAEGVQVTAILLPPKKRGNML